jgi:phage I-like protein
MNPAQHHTLTGRPPCGVAIAALGVDLVAGRAPAAFRVLPAGAFRSWDGRPQDCPGWVCTEADGRRIVAELAGRARKSVIDYEHATLKAKKDAVKAPAAGWFGAAEWRADGVWLTGVEWTADALAHLAAKEYRYISPVFSYDSQTGHVQSLLHAALTNEPGLDALTDLAALAAEIFLSPSTSPENSMNELLKKLLAALDLKENATETEALAAVEKHKANVAALAASQAEADGLKNQVAALTAQAGSPDPKKFAPTEALAALQAGNAELKKAFAALSAEIGAGKVEALISQGKAAGQLPPAVEPWARDLGKKDYAALSAFLEHAPVIVKPGETQTGGQAPGGGEGAADGGALAQAALSYQAEQAGKGISVTTVQAVAHVTKQKGA